MKKTLIATIVGALILFIWQFLSWAMLNIHQSQMSYTPQQDQILDALNTANLEEGTYFLPNVPPGTSSEDAAAQMEGREGNPWAIVSYRQDLKMAMGMNMFRAFIGNFVAIWILCWFLMKIPGLDLKTSLYVCIGVGLIGYLTINYLNSIWFENNSIPDLIDAVVSWGLVGLWLGWWLPRP